MKLAREVVFVVQAHLNNHLFFVYKRRENSHLLLTTGYIFLCMT